MQLLFSSHCKTWLAWHILPNCCWVMRKYLPWAGALNTSSVVRRDVAFSMAGWRLDGTITSIFHLCHSNYFPLCPSLVKRAKEMFWEQQGFWTLRNMSTLAFGKGIGSAYISVEKVCLRKVSPWGEKLIAMTVPPLYHVYSWQALVHGHHVRSTLNSGLFYALYFTPMLCTSKKYYLQGRTGPPTSTKGQGL